MWEMLANAGVKPSYGIVGEALSPVIDALRRNGTAPPVKLYSTVSTVLSSLNTTPAPDAPPPAAP